MIDAVKNDDFNKPGSVENKIKSPGRTLIRRLVLLIFAIAGVLLLCQELAFSLTTVYWDVGSLLIVLAIVMVFLLGGRNLKSTYRDFSTGSSFIMGVTVLAIFIYESSRQIWVDFFKAITIALFVCAVIIFIMTTRADLRNSKKLEPAWIGLLSIGFIYIFSYMVQYVSISITGTDPVLSNVKKQGYYEFPWVTGLTIIFFCLYLITAAVYLAHAWQVRQKNQTRHAIGFRQSLGF